MPLASSSSSSSTSGHPPAARLFSSSTSDGPVDDLLLCGEDAASLSEDDNGQGLEQFASGLQHPAGVGDQDEGDEEEDEELVAAAWVRAEAAYSPGVGYRSRFHARSAHHLDADSRRLAVAWILKVRELYQFRPLTAYLAVNYMDRFLSRHALPQQQQQAAGGWPAQLLAVACLSLAAKMEETLVPSLLDLQAEDARFVFEPRTVQRMELLVLDALNWRLRSITPFAFIFFFACRADPGRTSTPYLTCRATHIILASIEEIEFLGQCPSAMAAAAIACAAREAPALNSLDPESAALWCDGLTRESIMNCYQLMQELIIHGGRKDGRRSELVPPPTRIQMSVDISSDVLSSSSTSSSSSSSSSRDSSSSSKRRKLSSCCWVDEGEGRRRPMGEGDDIN